MSPTVWKELGDYLILGTAILALVFVLSYAAFAPWQRSATGRNIMAVMVALTLNAGYFSYAVQRGKPPVGFYPIRAMLFLGLFAVILQRIILFTKVQLLNRKEARNVAEVRKEPGDAAGDAGYGSARDVSGAGR